MKFADDSNEDQNVPKTKSKSTSTPYLDNYAIDLVKMAKNGTIDPVYGREKEIEEIINVLNKKKKNNPILVGAPGTGKTAIVESLALKICNKDCDLWLSKYKLYSINIGSLISGTKYRGDFEHRMEELVKEVENTPNIIVFFDEIHNLIGAGGASGSMDAANIIKPVLTRGKIKCIGATTFEEYKKTIEKDGAFERRFQKIYVSEPNKKETIDIIKNVKYRYEDYHGVVFSEKIVNQIVDIADKYINYRCFPDKAFDLMDEVGAKVKLQNFNKIPSHILELQKKLKIAEKNKEEAKEKQAFENAAKFRDEERILLTEIENEEKKWKEKIVSDKIEVTENDVALIISNRTGIPVHKFHKEEGERLKGLSEYLKSKVIGQDETIDKVAMAIQRSRLGIQDPNRPIASFLFLGSTGTGKCVIGDTKIKVRNKKDGTISYLSIEDFLNSLPKTNSSKKKHS